MPGINEAVRALIGSFLLAKRDLEGFNYFDHSIGGFWRSFAAIILIAPVFFVSSFAERQMSADIGGEVAAVAVHAASNTSGYLLGLVLQWIGYPVALVFVTRLFGLSHRYASYIIVYNWSSVLVSYGLFLPVLLYLLGAASASTAAVLNLVLLMPAVYYRWFIARESLETTPALATSLVALDFVLSMVLLQVAISLFV